ncbi:MAG: DUF2784 domain-containing protein [Thermodesulfobacteriota bacterium]
MQTPSLYRLAADLILAGHVLVAGFIVFGLALILAGKVFSWGWVRNPWFRLLHLLAIGVVALQSWLGRICPLTTWEMALREKAGDAVYAGSFIAHWLGRVLYYQVPAWVFVACYTIFGALVVFAWFRVRPRSFRGGMNMTNKLFLVLLILVVFFLPARGDEDLPQWVKDRITAYKAGPPGNPGHEIWQYEYKGEIVYYVPPQCCDVESDLYNARGVTICSPDGGYTGSGDGRCPDFFEKRQNGRLVWKDSRAGNKTSPEHR